MDRNSVTGIVLILAMLLGYQYFFAPKEPIKSETSVKAASSPKKVDSLVSKATPAVAKLDTAVAAIKEESFVLENKDIKVQLSNYGGKIVSVILKNYESYKNYNQGLKAGLKLFDAKKDQFDVELPISGKKVKLNDLTYQAKKSGESIEFISTLPSGKLIKQTYSLAKEGFELNYAIDAKSLGVDLGTEYQIHWKENIHQTEKDIAEERKATINYLLHEDEEFDYLSENPSANEAENITSKVDWITFKKKYFIAGLIPQGFQFQKASLSSTPNLNDSLNIKTLDANIVASSQDLISGKSSFKFYFGPNDYSIIKHVAPSFGKNVKLSYDFLLPITRYVFVPLFDFLESIVSNYGLLIVLLVLIIKTALLPLTYKSYVSMAKTRILAPEIAAIKEKIGDDAARVQQETMKLYGEVGVNPLSGCIPVLATMPVLMAVFMLFPNLINLRQESFWWANDLSTFDSVLDLPFNIPFYGSHVSLFCLLMTLSQLAYGYYNNQITPDQPGQPINMKMMAYVTPVIFMFVMNSFPAGLSFYYFVSNLVTIGQQLAIRKFVDEDKIKRLLDENRKKIAAGGGAKKSRFSQYLQTQMKAIEEQQKDQKNTNPKKKK
ncbi:membrane protein insertase YidC [Aquirufa nivalisilvae]|uniref:membrane protein insertase YidC n=1 Tax=Aquirufa nivalisilvae TaxID=2516557 RepID=UPI0022A9F260|nr:membrane protein insertase YidC [Aquirufa nivalisilvae]MCZ2482314.1 membrane protein insertase YidC [Aquirufa nivalisilvae]